MGDKRQQLCLADSCLVMCTHDDACIPMPHAGSGGLRERLTSTAIGISIRRIDYIQESDMHTKLSTCYIHYYPSLGHHVLPYNFPKITSAAQVLQNRRTTGSIYLPAARKGGTPAKGAHHYQVVAAKLIFPDVCLALCSLPLYSAHTL